jgi:hypothetical protein
MPAKSRHLVGVSSQYASVLGKNAFFRRYA